MTKASFKKFIRDHKDKMLINIRSAFDGMTDSCESNNNGWQPLEAEDEKHAFENNLGLKGVWLVGHGRDYFKPLVDSDYYGIEVSNCCGHFMVGCKR